LTISISRNELPIFITVLQYSGNTENSIGDTCQYQYNIAMLTTLEVTYGLSIETKIDDLA